MKKNSVIGWVLIAAIMIGFMLLQSKKMEKAQLERRQADSIARAEYLEQYRRDSVAKAYRDSVAKAEEDSLKAIGKWEETREEAVPQQIEEPVTPVDTSAAAIGEEQLVTLSNDKLEVKLSTRGGQPYSALVKDYTTYGKDPLYIFNSEVTGAANAFNVNIAVGEKERTAINTVDYYFELVSYTDSSAVMRLPFKNGGYIEQAYTLKKDSYLLDNTLSFVGMDFPKNLYSFFVGWDMIIPRMEKGYRNEVQYSKAAFRPVGEDPEEFAKGRGDHKEGQYRVSWVAYHQQFFSAIFRAKSNMDDLKSTVVFYKEDDPSHNLMACSTRFQKSIDKSSPMVYEHEFYFGPNSYNGLRALDQEYEKTIPLGGSIIGLFTRYVIIPVFNFLDGFNLNYGIIILLMTIFIKIVVLPLAYKSFVSSAKMQILKPEVEKINAKYPKQEDAMKKQQATMALYKRAGASMFGGCLPMLLQFPILWAMFRFFPASIELRQQHFLWAEDLSSYDSILNFGGGIPLIGDHLSLFALLMAVSMFFYTKFTQSAQMSSSDPNGKMMRGMTLYFMPVMMFLICNSLSSGLSYYYLISNIITMIETWVVRKWIVKPEDVYARLRATEGKPMPKSKWQQRLEEAQRMQQQQQKNGRR